MVFAIVLAGICNSDASCAGFGYVIKGSLVELISND